MNTKKILNLGKAVLLGSFLATAMLSLQACNDQAKEVKTAKTLKSNCQMQKCKDGKCGTAKTAKCNTGKCGDAKKAPAMKCEAGKCAAGKCGQGK